MHSIFCIFFQSSKKSNYRSSIASQSRRSQQVASVLPCFLFSFFFIPFFLSFFLYFNLYLFLITGYLLRGSIHAALKNREKAIADFSTVISMDTQSAEACMFSCPSPSRPSPLANLLSFSSLCLLTFYQISAEGDSTTWEVTKRDQKLISKPPPSWIRWACRNEFKSFYSSLQGSVVLDNNNNNWSELLISLTAEDRGGREGGEEEEDEEEDKEDEEFILNLLMWMSILFFYDINHSRIHCFILLFFPFHFIFFSQN